jgi:hypothetical protein
VDSSLNPDSRLACLSPDENAGAGKNSVTRRLVKRAAALAATIHDLYTTTEPAAFASAGWLVLDTSDLSVEETFTAILRSTARQR